MGQSAEVMHAEMVLRRLKERGIVGYRHDPGVPLLRASIAVLILVMALRIYLPWYQIRCHADDSTDRTLVTISIRMVGLFARTEREKQKLCDAFHK